MIIILSVLIAPLLHVPRGDGTPFGSGQWHFFFLGAAFMLLEAHIVSQMALLFGTTWVVNSIGDSGSDGVDRGGQPDRAFGGRGIAVTFAYVGIFALT